MKKTLLNTVYSLGGFSPFHRLHRNDVLILTYHRFSEGYDPLRVSRDEFEGHLAYLMKNNSVIGLDEVIDSFENDEELPPNSTVITIDDGYRDAYEVAFPLLRKYRVPATLYAITDFLNDKIWLWTDLMRYAMLETKLNSVEIKLRGNELLSAEIGGRDSRISIAGRINEYLKKLTEDNKTERIKEIAFALGVDLPTLPTAEFAPITWTQARDMDESGVRIQCHTVSHPILTNIDSKRLRIELELSREVIEERVGRKPAHFCYPNGALNDSVRDAVEKAGFASAVTTNYGFCNRKTDRFRLRRIDGLPGIANFAQSVSGFENLRGKFGI